MILWYLAACSGIPITEQERAELEQLMVVAEEKALPFETKRREVLAAAYGRVGSRPDLGNCPIAVMPPAADDQGMWADEGNVTFQMGTSPISIVQAKDIAISEGPRYDRVGTALVNDVQSMLFYAYRAKDRQEIDDGFARARQLADPTWLNVDGTLVIDEWAEPKADKDSFEGGWIVGRFYLYSYDEEAIVCASDVRAGNSDSLGVHLHYGEDDGFKIAHSDLMRDLYRNSVKVGIDKLAKAGPWMMTIQ